MTTPNNREDTMQYAQGDLLLLRTDALPVRAKLTPQAPQAGRLILAYGEATGHHHSLSPDYGTLATDTKGTLWLTIDELLAPEIRGGFPLLDAFPEFVVFEHPVWGRTAVARSECDAITATSVQLSGRFAPIEHQEHGAIATRPGIWEVRRQVEWTDEMEPRFVGD